jgi:glycosyltransferase involved in cell wall biosynthesis
MAPLVSVVIPTYNRAHLIAQALESVYAQTFKDYEVILIDDGSTDGTEELIRKNYHGRLRYVKQENKGISGARNHGIALASGKYIAFLDSDDRWLPEKLERQAAYMETHPETGLLCTKLARYEIGGDGKKEICPSGFPKHFSELLEGPNFIPTTTTMVRKTCFEKAGVFDPELPVAEDWDLWIRIAKNFGMYCLEDVLAEHRDHPQKTTKDLVKVYDGFWRFYAKNLRLHSEHLPDLKTYKRKAAAFRYLLGTSLLKQGKRRKSLGHILGALMMDPFVGLYFHRPEGGPTRPGLMAKPYGALSLNLLGALLPEASERRK